MRHFFLLMVFIALAATASAQDLTAFQKETFVSATGLELPYRILYPENYDKTKKYPLVLFLHGAGERGNNNESQLTHGARLFVDPANRQAYPAIVIFPQCPTEGYWSSVEIDRNTSPLTLKFDYSRPITPALQAAIELVQKMVVNEGVDKSRVYITGLSMGGMGTFEAVYRYPRLFAAAEPICGGADVKAYDKRVSKIPFRVFHGAKDVVVDVRHSQAIVEKLKILNTKVEYIEYPEVNHNSWDNAFAEPDFLSWMFSRKRKK
jgi:predicted peptidase